VRQPPVYLFYAAIADVMRAPTSWSDRHDVVSSAMTSHCALIPSNLILYVIAWGTLVASLLGVVD